MNVSVATSDVELAGTTLVAGVMEGLQPIGGSENVFETADEETLAASGFEGKTGQTVVLGHPSAAALLLVGLGDVLSFESLRDASGNAVRKARTEKVVSLLAGADLDGATRAVVEGSMLGGYEFRRYKTEEGGLDAQSVAVVGADSTELSEAAIACEATILARDLVNTPAKDKAPEMLASLIAEAASGAGVEVDVWDRSRIEEEKLGAVLGVAAGSDRDPRVVTLTYRPQDARAHLALVGKGIVFDTGGLSIKTAAFMEEMKDDMSGAAVVASATIGIARLGLPLDVTCITPLTDNAISGDATRPGDVLRPLDGPTIEVLNTDAEGRLVLADGLGLAKRYEPDLTIDVATLTGAARVALGDKYAAVFGSTSEVSEQVLAAASRSGERFWEMPLVKDYRKGIESEVADIKNISGSRYGGAITAAVFLAEFAGDGPWAHLDIAGPARARETSGDQVKGASGVGVRTLIELAREMSLVG